MPHPQHSEIQIPIPFSAFVMAIDHLPTEALLLLLHATEAALATRAESRLAGQMIQVEEAQFWESELGQYIIAEADDSTTIEDVRQALSVIPGVLATEISRERDER